MFWSIAYAQAAAKPQPTVLESVLPLLLMFVVFYFLLIVPSRKAKKKQAEFIAGLKRGDEVMTSGGILGRVEGLTEQVLTLEIADQTRIKILRSQVVQNPLKEKQ